MKGSKICALIPGNTISTLTQPDSGLRIWDLRKNKHCKNFVSCSAIEGIYIVSQKKLDLLKWTQARRSYFFWDCVKKHLLVVLGLFDVEVVGSLVGEHEGPCVGSPDSIIIPHIILKVRG